MEGGWGDVDKKESWHRMAYGWMRTEVNRVDSCQFLSVRDIEGGVQPNDGHRKKLENNGQCVGALEDEAFVRAS